MRRLMEAIQRALIGLFEAAQWTLFLPFRFLRGVFTSEMRQESREQADQAAAEIQKASTEKLVKVRDAIDIKRIASLVQRAAAWKFRGRDFEKTFGELMSKSHVDWVKALTIQECETLARTDARVVCSFLSGRKESLPGVRLPREIALPQPRVSREPPQRTEEEQIILNRLAQRIAARRYAEHTHDNDCEPTPKRHVMN